MKTEGYYVNTGRWQSVNGKKDKNCGVRDGRGIAGDISSVQTDRQTFMLEYQKMHTVIIRSMEIMYAFSRSRKPMG